ncbi:MAG: hypothetical protein IPP74_01765 [Alphaproteobacteria bacterium]|nr:hypothetical protein [Alphaproteobacteria bacterium]
MSAPLKPVLIVLGMHRSGTSALSGICHMLGVHMGEAFLEPTKDNPKGYFEDIACVDIQERILKFFNMSWDSYSLLPSGWHQLRSMTPFREELKALISTRDSHMIWGIKDPRLCRLLPLWLDIFSELGFSPHFLIPIRNPHEVSSSLVQRDQLRIHHSLMLWFVHNLEAEFYTRPYPRILINYPSYLEKWESIYQVLTQNWHFELPPITSEVKHHIDDFLCSTLYRHRLASHVTPVQIAFPTVRTMWTILQKLTFTQSEYDVLNEFWHESRFWLYAFTDSLETLQHSNRNFTRSSQTLSEHYEQLLAENKSFIEQLQIIQTMIADLEVNLDLMKNSLSWRLTAPLRILKKQVKSLPWLLKK